VPIRKPILSSCSIPEFLADLVDESGEGREGRGFWIWSREDRRGEWKYL
jgi:hypothetical protein